MDNAKSIMVLLMCLFLSGVAAGQTDEKTGKKAKKKNKARQEVQIAESAPISNEAPDLSSLYEAAEVIVENKPGGSVHWSDQYVEARGESVIDTSRFKNPAQARAMATRGAVVVAQRNLLEIINGVRVHGETTVENMILTEDLIFTRVDGLIKGAEIVGEPREEWGMMVVTMRVPLYQKNGLAGALFPSLEKSHKSSPATLQDIQDELPEEALGELGQFVFNMGDKLFDPSLFPIITDENGNILLDLTKIYNPDLGQFPKILKTTRELFSESGFDQGVQVIDIIDSFDGRLVVDAKAKKKVNWDKVASTVAKIGKILLLFV